MQRDAAEALQPTHGGRERWRKGKLLDLAIELLSPLQLVGEERVILAEHQPIGWGERRRLTGEVFEPPEVRGAPVGALPIYEPAPREELENVVPGLHDLPLERFPPADDIAHSFLRLARDAHRGEFPGAVESGEIGGVSFIVFALHAGPLWDERRSDEARIAALLKKAVS